MLQHELNIKDVDFFYEELINAQRDLSDADAQSFNAMVMLILANHIGDRDVLREAFALARKKLETQ